MVKKVAPLVGAWIETLHIQVNAVEELVAPLVGAWIETEDIDGSAARPESHPSWVRGLKPTVLFMVVIALSVAPLVGAWIETFDATFLGKSPSRTPRGCVD